MLAILVAPHALMMKQVMREFKVRSGIFFRVVIRDKS
jgi:hypothetical protein